MFLKKIVVCMSLLAISLSGVAQNVYTIYPVPHSQQALGGKVSFTKVVNVVADASIDEVTIARAKDVLTAKGLTVQVGKRANNKVSNVFLGVALKNGVATAMAKKWHMETEVFNKVGKFDKHLLCITSNGGKANVMILGENTDATFCGLA